MSGSEALAAEVMQTRTTMVMIVCEVQLAKERNLLQLDLWCAWCALHAGTCRMFVKKDTTGAWTDGVVIDVQEVWLTCEIKVTPICEERCALGVKETRADWLLGQRSEIV